MAALMKYEHIGHLMDDTIVDPTDRMIDLQARLIGNCTEIVELLKADTSSWSIKTTAHLTILVAMLEDDRNEQLTKSNY
jgi:hypothetical protein